MKASANFDSWQNFEEKKARLKASMPQDEEKISILKSSSNLFRALKSKKSGLDVRSFNQVLNIDAEALTADVEGMTTYETLVQATLAKECLPTVVPELKSITVGGATVGLGIESSSFRYGLVHETVLEMEILLGNGQIVTCTPHNEYQDLFFAFPNTYGTLGYALRLKIKLVPAKKYIKLSHYPYTSSKAFFSALENACQQNRSPTSNIAFIDGTIFGPSEFYLTCGEFTDKAPYLNSYKYMKIYYKSIQTRKEDFLRTIDYIWRWDADWFWCSKQFGMENKWLRFLLGKWMLSSVVYTRLMRFFQRPIFNPFFSKKESIIQDVLIPIEQAEPFLEFLQKKIQITPIWICPSSSPTESSVYDFCPLDPKKLYVDFGFWGSIESEHKAGHYNRMIEKMAVSLGGLKSLYSSSYYPLDEFWSIYNQSRYQFLKSKYDPQTRLGSLYDKSIV